MKQAVAWITGAAGFLGRHTARRLAQEGWHVVGLAERDADGAWCRAWGFQGWAVGPLEPAAMDAAAGIHPMPDLILHAAGTSSVGAAAAAPLTAFDRTVRSTAVLLDMVRRHCPDAYVVYPSSAAVYGDNPGGPLAEDRPCCPASSYGWYKLMAETALSEAGAQHGIRSTAIRFFSLYGPELRKQVLWDWSRQLLAAKGPLTFGGTGAEVRDFLHVDDAVRLIMDLAGLAPADRPSLINGGTGRGIAMADLGGRLSAALGMNAEIVFDGTRRPGDPACYLAATGRLEAMGFTPHVALDEGLALYAAWVKAALERTT